MERACMGSREPWVLQICHGYDGPFLDCARQYARLFQGGPYKVLTVYLTGGANVEVVAGSASEEVVFLEHSSADLRGLKLGVIAQVRRLVASRNFRFCIAHRFKPTYVALLATCLPVMGVSHAFGVYRRPARQLFANLFKKRLMLFAVSNAVRDDIRSCLPRWPARRIETFYNRIDVGAQQSEQLDKIEARQVLGLPLEALIIGNAGRLHPDKDQATLLRGFAHALPRLPDGSLLAIMGHGRSDGALRHLAHELGITDQVRFLGQVPSGRRYFKAFDVFALTSDREPFGMVLLEAMAAGLPVVCSDCGGGPEVVAGCGFLFPFGDPERLAVALLDSITEEPRAISCRAALQSFSDEAACERFQVLLRELRTDEYWRDALL